MDGGLKLSVSPRFWWTLGRTAGRLVQVSAKILWDITGWCCRQATFRTALKVGLCGFTGVQLRLGNGELAAGGWVLLSHVGALSKVSTSAGMFGGRVLTRGMAEAYIWEAMLNHEAYPRSWRAAPNLG